MPASITTFDELVICLNLQKTNLAVFSAAVNGTPADLTEVTNDVGNLQAIDDYVELVNAYKKAVVEIKQTLFNGEPGTPIPVYPPNLTPPTLVAPQSGSLQRSRKRNGRFKKGPGYTDVIGDALGISPTETPPSPATAPKIEVSAAQTGYEFSVVVANRQESDAWELLVQPVGATAWTTLGFSTTKSLDFVYPPGTSAGQPVQLRVRVQLKRNNANYGPPSDIVLVTVNP